MKTIVAILIATGIAYIVGGWLTDALVWSFDLQGSRLGPLSAWGLISAVLMAIIGLAVAIKLHMVFDGEEKRGRRRRPI